jgi:hypothetical protein
MSPDKEGNIIIPKVNNYELRPIILTFRCQDFLHHGNMPMQDSPNDVTSEGNITKMKKIDPLQGGPGNKTKYWK